MSTFRRDTPGALAPPSVSVLFVISGHWCGRASHSALIFPEGTTCLGVRQLAKLVTRSLFKETSTGDETQAYSEREQVPHSTKPFTQITSNGLFICLSSFMALCTHAEVIPLHISNFLLRFLTFLQNYRIFF